MQSQATVQPLANGLANAIFNHPDLPLVMYRIVTRENQIKGYDPYNSIPVAVGLCKRRNRNGDH